MTKRVHRVFALFTIFVVILLISLCGCSSSSDISGGKEGKKETQIEKIYREQQEQKNSEEFQKKKKSLSQSILDNIKKNSEKSVNSVMEDSQKKKPKPQNDRTFTEEMDYMSVKVSDSLWGGLFSFLFALQSIAIPGSLIFIIFGSVLAFIFRNDKPKFKWFLILAIGGPTLFLVITYLPALFWYILKN